MIRLHWGELLAPPFLFGLGLLTRYFYRAVAGLRLERVYDLAESAVLEFRVAA